MPEHIYETYCAACQFESVCRENDDVCDSVLAELEAENPGAQPQRTAPTEGNNGAGCSFLRRPKTVEKRGLFVLRPKIG